MITPYPQSMPVDSIKLVINKIRNNSDPSVKLADVVHAGWEVSGYALSQTLGNPGATVASFGASSSPECTPEEVANHLGGCISNPVRMSISWGSVAIVVLKLLLEQWIRE